jgi:catechol 2,3-dioxygenase-like lactoylglutathione lyase family enzyme
LANQTGRPIAPARKLVAAVLGTIAVFVMVFGLGLASWAIVVLGLAVLALSIALGVVNVVRRGARAWVAGTAQVKAISEPPISAAYGRAELQIVVVAPGLPITEVLVRDPRVPVSKWPRLGETLPVMVDVEDMRRVRIDWPNAPDIADPPPPGQSYTDIPATEDPLDEYDDDLLGPLPPPPWAGNAQWAPESQWAPEEQPPPPPAPAGESGDARTIDGEVVAPDDTAPPLPRRPRPSPRPRSGAAATATVEPETERDSELSEADEFVAAQAAASSPAEPSTETSAATPVVDDDIDLPLDPQPPAPSTVTPPPADPPRFVPPPREKPAEETDSGAAPTIPAQSTTHADDAPVISGVDVPVAAAAGGSGPWSDLEGGGYEPDDRADEVITGYPSARPGPAGAIHGVGLTVLVTELERAIAFYRDTLGFYEIDRGEGNAVLASGDTRLVLRTVGSLSAAGRLVYVNLEVGDIEATYRELVAKGVTFEHPPQVVNHGERLELWSATFHDPDGHNIAITQWRSTGRAD